MPASDEPDCQRSAHRTAWRPLWRTVLSRCRSRPPQLLLAIRSRKIRTRGGQQSRIPQIIAADNVKHLRQLSGAAFDRAYIDHEVTYHQQVLDALDNTLIPNAKNDQLKSLLSKVRPAFVARLEHAKQLQASVGKTH